MIILRNIGLRRGGKRLLQGVDVTLQPGQRIALIGANGCGKSSLLGLLLGELAADNGDIEGIKPLRLAHMAQEVTATNYSACEYVWRGDATLAQLRDQLQELEAQGDYDRAAGIYQALEDIDGYSAERRAQRLLQGLGFADEDMTKSVQEFSGGWRIRLNLAQALMSPSDLLLLDEPTNHLDLDATLWLQDWLRQYSGTLLLISHDRDFIDATCTRVLHIEQRKLQSYSGNYSDFEQQRALRLAQEQASYEKQQRRRAEIDAFVSRFRYKATKARQAQSRLKELERMRELAPAHVDSPFSFSIPAAAKSSDPLLTLEKATLGYENATVLQNVELQVRPGARIGLLGRNGAGKTTLLKSLIGQVPLIDGERSSGAHLRVGYFDQQQLEALDLEASPALHIQRLSPEVREQEVLNFLGGFNFHGDAATEPVAPLSGGEKARLALAMVVWQRPNLLVLDEPTNHLDLEMRFALEMALQGFEGALLLVSHDRHLLRNTVDELLLVHAQRVHEYAEDLNAYEQWVLTTLQDAAQPIQDSGNTKRKSQRQQAAAQRDRLRPLKNKLATTEAELGELEQTLAQLQAQLADNDLYADHRKEELATLLRREGDAKAAAAELEENWLALQEELESINAPKD